MPQPPSFPFYPADWLLGTLTFSLAEDGAYLRLVMHQWNAGSVPGDDLRAVASILRVSERDARAVWATVSAKFERGDDGLWRNARVERQRAEKVRYHAAQSANGQASAAARAQRKANQTPAMVKPPLQPDSNLSLALASVPNGTGGAHGTRYRDPNGFRPDPTAAATVFWGEGQQFSIPDRWATPARGKYGLSHADVDTFAKWLGAVVTRAGGVQDGGKFFGWLDAQAATWLESRRHGDAPPSAREFIEAQDRRAAELPKLSPAKVRALLGRPVMNG